MDEWDNGEWSRDNGEDPSRELNPSELKQKRRQAYLAAKAAQLADPEFIAQLAEEKSRARAAYLEAKALRQSRERAARLAKKASQAHLKAQARQAKFAALAQFVLPASSLQSKEVDAHESAKGESEGEG